MNILQKLSQVKSLSSKQGRTYHIESLLALVLAGFMSNCNSYESVHRMAGQVSKSVLRKLGLGSIPCLSTITENMRKVDADSLEQILKEIALSFCKQNKQQKTNVSMDGKTLRGSKRQENNAHHVLGIFAHNTSNQYGQYIISNSENEITGAIKLLDSLDLKDLVITGDAIFAQKHIIEKIVDKEGSFLLTVKDNQERLKYEIEEGLAKTDPTSVRFYKEEITKAHGRIEQRSIRVIDMPWEYLNAWRFISQIACIERFRQVKIKGKWQEPSIEKSYVISNLTAQDFGPQSLLKLNREHWHIENKVHWVRDVVFREDQSNIRFSARIAVSLKNLAISFLTQISAGITKLRQIFSHKPHLLINQLLAAKFK